MLLAEFANVLDGSGTVLFRRSDILSKLILEPSIRNLCALFTCLYGYRCFRLNYTTF